ncbi:hypothetical protein BpHYR1_040216 [Brachionus plicatilis]|uniref:Uncharacterized protein n=1 Tax=Brachionus plicatilis TaxID=10195 RepID=A0A3M7S1B3_BRAPC|nr:hypothetical protein BpHYR1_040216 [Brachionus plicatilis]
MNSILGTSEQKNDYLISIVMILQGYHLKEKMRVLYHSWTICILFCKKKSQLIWHLEVDDQFKISFQFKNNMIYMQCRFINHLNHSKRLRSYPKIQSMSKMSDGYEVHRNAGFFRWICMAMYDRKQEISLRDGTYLEKFRIDAPVTILAFDKI